MWGKIFFYILLIIGLILIIYGLSEFSFSSILSILALGIGIAFVGIAIMISYSSKE